jgi:coatomer protein complex subunit gamma
MSYGKKDEDADSALVKIDRTQVFQEGEPPPQPAIPPNRRHSAGTS